MIEAIIRWSISNRFIVVLMSVILVGLDNIQDYLENPFDQIGEDDIVFNAEKFVERLEL